MRKSDKINVIFVSISDNGGYDTNNIHAINIIWCVLYGVCDFL